jgi:uncharacterized protein (DUF924 family)
MNPEDILHFWFQEIEQSQWWIKDLAFDQLIIQPMIVSYLSGVLRQEEDSLK